MHIAMIGLWLLAQAAPGNRVLVDGFENNAPGWKYVGGEEFPGAKGSSGWSAYFHMARLNGAAPRAMIFNKMTTKIALGAVVTHAPAMTELEQDPLTIIETGDWVKVDADNGIVEITKRAKSSHM